MPNSNNSCTYDRYKSMFPVCENISQLKAWRREIRGDEKIIYDFIIKQILQNIQEHVEALLSPPVVKAETDAIVTDDQKNKYGPYGLLLNAFKLTNDSLKTDDISVEDIKEKACEGLMLNLGANCITINVESSIKLTREMLFLLPPLVIGKVTVYHEELSETNRKTWNEKRKDALQCYRPTLFFGNQFQVAAKGLVGNTLDPEEEKEEQEMPDLSTGSKKGEETEHDDVNPETIIGEQTKISPQAEEQIAKDNSEVLGDKSQSEGEINSDEEESGETII